MGETLGSWLYISASRLSAAEAPDALEQLVTASRARNATIGVTGALLFTGTRFCQFIEGPADSIAALQASIRADPRHDHVTTIAEAPVAQRGFSNWSLAYAGPSHYIAAQLDKALAENEADPRDGARRLIRLLGEFSA